MNIAVLGGGVEGKALEEYFKQKGDTVTVFDGFSDEDIPSLKLEQFDEVFRSPSVHPQFCIREEFRGESKNWTSMTNYFFEHCKAPIIGVTATKGKGTTCSMIAAILNQIIENRTSDKISPTAKVHLVGNFGIPSISKLDEIQLTDIVVYEMSSFQCWDLQKSPEVAVVGRIEPDHLDRHLNFDDYVNAKSNIARHQTANDAIIYYKNNEFSEEIASLSPARHFTYPDERLKTLANTLIIPGEHNKENAEAAILAVSAFLQTNILEDEALRSATTEALKNYKSLPHRIQFVRNLNGVDYYDDSYSSAFPALDVAVSAFEGRPTVLICGGKDRHLDLSETKHRIFSETTPSGAPTNLKKVILIGETRKMLASGEKPEKYEFAETLEEAVKKARKIAEKFAVRKDGADPNSTDQNDNAKQSEYNYPVVLLSPGAASFDMFKNFSDRGEKFQKIVKELK